MEKGFSASFLRMPIGLPCHSVGVCEDCIAEFFGEGNLFLVSHLFSQGQPPRVSQPVPASRGGFLALKFPVLAAMDISVLSVARS